MKRLQRTESVRELGSHAATGEARPAEEEGEWLPGTCVTGGGIASGLGIGSAMAMLEVAQDLPVEDDPPG